MDYNSVSNVGLIQVWLFGLKKLKIELWNLKWKMSFWLQVSRLNLNFFFDGVTWLLDIIMWCAVEMDDEVDVFVNNDTPIIESNCNLMIIIDDILIKK